MPSPAASMPLEQAVALQWSLTALERLTDQLAGLPAAEEHAQAAFVAAVQAVWWASALDEQSCRAEGQPYKARRDADDMGRVVWGLVWLRDRQSHQLPLAVGKDATPFFPGPPFHLVPAGFVWLPRAMLPPPDPHKERRNSAAAYDAHVAGVEARQTLAAAVDWFRRETQVLGSALEVASQVPPAMPASLRLNFHDIR